MSAADRFGAIHGRFGILQDVFRPAIKRLSLSNPYRSSRYRFSVVETKGFRKLIENSFRHKSGIGDVFDIFQENGKFVRPQPRNRIAEAKAVFQSARAIAENLIADHLAEAVIQRFELIDVHDQYRKLEILSAFDSLESAVETVHKQRAVGQAGQRIVQGIMSRLPFGNVF